MQIRTMRGVGVKDEIYYIEMPPPNSHVDLYLDRQKKEKALEHFKAYEKTKETRAKLIAKKVKLKIGKQYLAIINGIKFPNNVNDRYRFKILAINQERKYNPKRKFTNRYLGIKVGMGMDESSRESNHVFWFDEDGTSLDGTFKIYAISKSEMRSNDNI